MTNTQDAIAAFLAKGGNVSKVETGATNGMSALERVNEAEKTK